MSETPDHAPRTRIEGWRLARAAAWGSCICAAVFLAQGAMLLTLAWSITALSWAVAARRMHRKDR